MVCKKVDAPENPSAPEKNDIVEKLKTLLKNAQEMITTSCNELNNEKNKVLQFGVIVDDKPHTVADICKVVELMQSACRIFAAYISDFDALAAPRFASIEKALSEPLSESLKKALVTNALHGKSYPYAASLLSAEGRVLSRILEEPGVDYTLTTQALRHPQSPQDIVDGFADAVGAQMARTAVGQPSRTNADAVRLDTLIANRAFRISKAVESGGNPMADPVRFRTGYRDRGLLGMPVPHNGTTPVPQVWPRHRKW